MRKLAYLLAAAALIGSVFIPQSATAATSANHPRVATIIASNNYVVYKQKTTSGTISNQQFTGGALYAVDKNGKRQSLPGFSNSSKHFLYITGDMLVQATTSIHNTMTDHESLRWRNLKTGTTGTYTSPTVNTALVAAAPDGWLAEYPTSAQTPYGTVFALEYVHTNGTIQKIGTPYTDGRDYRVVTSDTGVIFTPGISDEDATASQLKYMTWNNLGQYKTLYTTKGGADTGITCVTPSTTYVACSLITADSTVKSGLISLSGQGAKWMQDTHPTVCKFIDYTTKGGSLFAIETSNAGVCTTGKLFRFNFAGQLISNGSGHLYSAPAGITAGLGKVLVSSTDQRHVDTLSNLPQNPHILVKV